MSIIPEEELKNSSSLNLAPMVDFLFLVVAVFATLAVTRAALFDNEINLVKLAPVNEQSPLMGNEEQYVINLSVNEKGQYKWIAEFNDYLIENVSGVRAELNKQQMLGLLPKDPSKTKILLHIDKAAQWEPIAQIIFTVKEAGFNIRPVYDLND